MPAHVTKRSLSSQAYLDLIPCALLIEVCFGLACLLGFLLGLQPQQLELVIDGGGFHLQVVILRELGVGEADLQRGFD
eukprot:scaffold680_cov264-Pinguiococcus_pyrenoidosus.AAC.29